LTIFANTTQRKLQFVTRIQLSKNSAVRNTLYTATNLERLVNGDSNRTTLR
jgi:hypothetical protein